MMPSWQLQILNPCRFSTSGTDPDKIDEPKTTLPEAICSCLSVLTLGEDASLGLNGLGMDNKGLDGPGEGLEEAD